MSYDIYFFFNPGFPLIVDLKKKAAPKMWRAGPALGFVYKMNVAIGGCR